MAAPIDIAGEFAAAGEALQRKGWDSLAHLGLTRAAVEAIGFAGIARVRGYADGRYWLSAQGTPAVIVPAYAGRIYDAAGGWGSALIDLVAWIPNIGGKGQGDRLLTRLGEAKLLGAAELADAVGQGLALRLFRNPGGWGAAGAVGAVVLDWRGAAALFNLPALVAEDASHAAEINRNLRRLRARLMPRLPDIAVMDQRAADAA